MYLKTITDTPPTVNIIRRGYVRQLEIELFEENVLQLHIYYHADGLGYVDCFLLHLIVNENLGYLHEQIERGLFLRNNTWSVLRSSPEKYIYDEYIMQIMSYDVSFSKGLSSVYVPNANDVNSMDLFRSIQKQIL